MGDITREEAKKLIQAALEENGLGRLPQMFGVDHNVPRGTHKTVAAAATHVHPESDVTNLVTDLAGKAAASHGHAEADVTNLVTDLAGKAAASHSHGGADITSGTLDGDRLPALSATKKGGVPATGTPSGNYLKDDGTWAAPAASGMGYALQVRATSLSPQDGVSYFFGSTVQPRPSSGSRLYIPKAGTLKVCYFWWDCSSTAGSNESISVYIRVNDTTDYLVKTIGNTALQKLFDKTDLSISLSQGDYIEIKMVCPTWGTSPLTVYLGGVVYIE
jgi:hypothetical protein